MVDRLEGGSYEDKGRTGREGRKWVQGCREG